ncbi:hypothetical protein AMATHDRAFT_61397 [Amanita thiersii Skay4041]|uniref:Mid2 domain-containing protein n=1 Tax=Amanita thiersii Skay4041 TaxID=703135 RepID=A0A2A9NPN7_9AGAR|nr:hypothetical protein AMATHDRAFT_61397 [Amanita thiersii Skay4041]
MGVWNPLLSPPLRWGCCCQLWLCLWLLLPQILYAQSAPQQNVTLDLTGPQFTYFPVVCSSRLSGKFMTGNSNSEQFCDGGWTIDSVDGLMVVTTNGTRASDLRVVPQVLFRVQASAVYLTTSRLSNATVVVAAKNISSTFNSSVGSIPDSISIHNLVETELTDVVVSFVPDISGLPTRLDLSFVVVTISANVSSIALPTMTLPPTVTLPTVTTAFSSSSTSTTTNSNSSSISATSSASASELSAAHRLLVAHAVGITLGLGLGLTALSVLMYILWRWWRRRRTRNMW